MDRRVDWLGHIPGGMVMGRIGDVKVYISAIFLNKNNSKSTKL
jgi:hypothetical protein